MNTEARWGDIVLFKINPDTPSHLSNSVSPSCWEWDHVGLVVLSQSEFSGEQQFEIDNSNPSLDLLELTSEGVTLYPLTGRLRAYNYHNVSDAFSPVPTSLSMFVIWDSENFVVFSERKRLLLS